MEIGYVMASQAGQTDHVLSETAQRLGARGIRLAGAVQINTERADRGCDMDLRILPGTRLLRISQSLGPGASGCRLDTAALEEAVGLTGAALELGAELMVINKFGKHEAEGRGFRELIGQALLGGTPVLIGVNATNREAFLDFAEGLAIPLPPHVPALEDWALSHLRPDRKDPEQ